VAGCGRGCVKTSGDYRDRAKGGDKVDCGSMLYKFVHQESPESESENFVLCFYTTSAVCRVSGGKASRSHCVVQFAAPPSSASADSSVCHAAWAFITATIFTGLLAALRALSVTCRD
jgi:hypothetical protein